MSIAEHLAVKEPNIIYTIHFYFCFVIIFTNKLYNIMSISCCSPNLTSFTPSGCACVDGPGGELCAAVGATEFFCWGDAGPALPAAPLLSPLLHGWKTLLQVGASY